MSDSQNATAGLQIEVDGKLHRLDLSRSATGEGWLGRLDGNPVEVDARLTQPGVLSLIVQGNSYRCVLDEGPVETAIHTGGQRLLITIDDPRSLTAQRRKQGASGGSRSSKLPCREGSFGCWFKLAMRSPHTRALSSSKP